MKEFIFYGDSITDARHLWDEDPLALGQGFVREIAEKLSAERMLLKDSNRETRSCRIVNRGQDGFTTANVLRLLQREGLRLKGPAQETVVTLLIGVNDLTVAAYADDLWIPWKFEQNLREILTCFRDASAGKILILEPFLFPYPQEHLRLMPLLKEEHRILQKLSEAFPASYIETQSIFLQTMKESGPEALTPDGIHLTAQGARILADIWMENAGLQG